MARIRTIKPEFWDSPSTARASAVARLAFIAMWNWADDAGRGTANLKELEGFIFPNDDVADLSGGKSRNFRDVITEVADAFGVTFYTVNGRPYYSIPSWKDHQRNERTAAGKHPGPEEADLPKTRQNAADGGTSDDLRDSAAELPQSSVPGTEEQRNRGTGEVGTGEQRADARDVAAAGFNEFWLRYPRKVDKPAARKAWDKAIKRAPIQKILDGASRYAADPNRVDQFTKHPGPWLNADAWDNPPLPSRTSSGRESSLTRRDRQREETFAELARLEQAQHPMGALGA